jgi:spermidine dehydrogenase
MSDHQDSGIDVTRRDFIGGTLLGTGTALLGMAAPAALSGTARAQTTGLSMIGLGPDWTGPSGIGDYAGKNGNTHTVVNAAHGEIRNGSLDKRIANAPVVDDVYDLIIVGSGISGLTAAYVFLDKKPNAKILVLDQHEIFGGEAKQNDVEVDGYRLTAPQGSTGIVVPFAKAIESGFPSPFIRELGFPTTFTLQEPKNLTKDILVPEDMWSPMHVGWERADMAYWYEGHGMVKNPWRDGFAKAPISDRLKKAFVDLELYRTPPRRDDWAQWLDSMTYKQFLLDVAQVPPDLIDDICAYFGPVMAAMGCGLGPDIVSAYQAWNYMMPGVIGYSRYLSGGADPTDQVYLATFPGGNTYQAKRFLKLAKPEALSGSDGLYDIQYSNVNWDKLDRPGDRYRLRLAATVFSVVHEGKPATAEFVRVTYEKGGKLQSVRARHVICAGQQHANRHICHDVSPTYRTAMNAFHHAPMLTLNVAVRNWKFLENLGVAAVRWFEGFGWWTSLRRNLVLDGKETQPLDPNKPVMLTQYIPFLVPDLPFPDQCTAARMQLFSMSFAQIEGLVRDQFTKMFGAYGFDADRDIAAIIANRQGHAYIVNHPGMQFGKDGQPSPLDVLKKPFNRIAFSHSELSGAQMWETAADEGKRAAERILAMS